MSPQIGVAKGIPSGVELTYRCNNNCVFCFYHEIKNLDEMPLHEAMESILRLKESGYKVIRLRGGEPTTYSKLDELLRFIKEEGLKVAMTTNCSKFDTAFSRKMRDFGLITVYTSLHGHTPRIHESITRRKGSFAETVAGIKNLLKLGVAVETNTTICSLNYDTFPEIAHFLCNEFDSLFSCRFSYLYLGNNQKLSDLLVDFTTLRPELEKAISIIEKEGKKFFIEKAPICAAPRYSSYFKAEKFVSDINYKPHICGQCAYFKDKYCVGVSRHYLEKFGEEGLIPLIKTKKK